MNDLTEFAILRIARFNHVSKLKDSLSWCTIVCAFSRIHSVVAFAGALDDFRGVDGLGQK